MKLLTQFTIAYLVLCQARAAVRHHHLAHGIQGVDGALRVRVHTGDLDR